MRRASLEDQVQFARLAAQVAKLGCWRLHVPTMAIQWSEEVFRMFGLEPGPEPSLEAAMSMLHPDDRSDWDARIKEVLQTGDSFNAVARIMWPDGQRRWVETRGVSECDASGVVTTVFGVMIDITDQRRSQEALGESEARYRLLAEHATDVVIRVDPSDTILYVSPSCRRYGYEPEELVGTAGYAITHPDDLPRLRGLISDLFSGAPVDRSANRDHRLKAKDGSWVWVEGSPSIVRDEQGRPREVVTQLRDITQRRAMEEQLRAARSEAERAAQAKSDFLANMSHEIRTPLSSILGFSKLLNERGDLDETEQRYVERIVSASDALLATVNDILDFSKVEAGEIKIERAPTSPRRVISDVLDLFEPQAASRGISLQFECDATVPDNLLMDAGRVRQIALNLVGNAIKFTIEGRVRATLQWEGEGGLLLCVSDSGPGISEADQDLLFRRFSQVDGSSTRRHGGTGLGLAICRGLAEAMGGEIGVESTLGRGSTFYVRLAAPLAQTVVLSKRPEIVIRDLAGTRLLVVDDNGSTRELVRLIAESMSIDVTDAASGAEAIAAANSVPFDVILMDVRMPEMGGEETLRRLRAGGGPNTDAPILAFTADVTPAAVASLLSAGFDGHLGKPVSAEKLIEAVAEWSIAEDDSLSRHD